VTVFLSSHRLGEVARVATRIGVLHQGRLVDEFVADALASRVRTRLEVGARDLVRAEWALHEAGFEACDTAGGPVQADRQVLAVEDVRALEHPELVAAALVRAGEPPTRIAVVEEDLETYFLRLVSSAAAAADVVREAPRVR
jgi:ABC-2 type transport system ATP-binding protein